MIKFIESICAGFAPALKPSFRVYASAWTTEGGRVASQTICRRRSGRMALLLTALSLLLCVNTFSAYAQDADPKVELGKELVRVWDDYLAPGKVATSRYGYDVLVGEKWVIQATYDILRAAYEDAKAVFETSGSTKEDCNLQLGFLWPATENFVAGFNDSGLKYDYTDLNDKLQLARETVRDVVSSSDGLDVPGDKKWFTPSIMTILSDSITAFENKKWELTDHGPNMAAARDSQQFVVNRMAGNLRTAINNITSSAVNGYMPDYSDLEATVAAAERTLNATAISPDGSDVPNTVRWVTQTDWDLFDAAVTLIRGQVNTNFYAQHSNLVTNQGLVDAEESSLNGQLTVFINTTSRLGEVGNQYNCYLLKAAIAAAKAFQTSIDGRDACGKALPDQYWVNSSDLAALEAAIQTGQGLMIYNGQQRTDPIQDAIDAATDALDDRTEDCEDNKQLGCMPDYSDLEVLIGNANALLTGTQISPSGDGREYSTTDSWVIQTDYDAFEAKIKAVDDAVKDKSLTSHNTLTDNQDEVDAAYAQLDEDIQDFSNPSLRKPGDQYVQQATDQSDLLALISAAELKLEIIPGSAPPTWKVKPSTDTGKDVEFGTKWLAANIYNNLTESYQRAFDLYPQLSVLNAFTQSYFNDTKQALTLANNAANPMEGRKANLSELDDEIAAAGDLIDIAVTPVLPKNGVVESTNVPPDGSDVAFGTEWVTPTMVSNLATALTAAINIKNGIPAPAVLHNEVSQLESALRKAIADFKKTTSAAQDAAPNVTVLNEECDKILAAVSAVKVSAVGGYDIKSTEMWVSPADTIAMRGNIASVRNPASPYVTHDDVIRALEDLKDDLDLFMASRLPGEKATFILASQEDEQELTVTGIPVAAFVDAICETPQLVNAGLPNVSYTIINGALPDGLTLNASTTGTGDLSGYDGTLIGMPTDTGRFVFTIQAVHAQNLLNPELLPCAITIYDAPVTKPTEPDFMDDDLISIQSDIVLHFPSAVPMNREVTGTVVFNDQSLTGYWATDTTFVVPCPTGYYEYETNYTLLVKGLVSRDGYLRYDRAYDFRTSSTPPDPTIPRSVTLLPLPYGVTSDKQPGQYWTTHEEGYRFELTLTVPPDETPTLITDRLIKDEKETVEGVPDPEAPDRYLFTVVQIHKAIEIGVVLSPRSDVGNEWTAGGGEDVRIRTSGGRVYVDSPVAGVLSVYSVGGVLQVQKSVTAGSSTTLSLPKGVYIVCLNERTYKVAVQ